MASSDKVALAIVGMGRWGEILVRSVQHTSDLAHFTTIVSRSPDRVAGTAENLSMRVCATLDEALGDPAIDGIVVTTPHSRHQEAIAACRAAGRPVLVEKPFTLTRAAADAALSNEDSLVCAAHNRRFLPSAMALAEMVEAGELGQLLHLEANFSGNMVGRYTPGMWRSDDTESPAGGLAGSGIHMIDLVIALAGPVSSVYAGSSRRVADLPIDDTMFAAFRLASGASANLTCVAATASCFRLQVFGTKGWAELRGPNSLAFASLDGAVVTRDFPPADIERAEIEAFARAIRGEQPFPVHLDEVLNGVSTFEAITRSLEEGGPVPVPAETGPSSN